MSMNETSNVSWWQKAGLPGMPIWAEGGRKMNDPTALIRDGNGKPVLFEKSNPEPLREALMVHLCRGVKVVRFVTDSGAIASYERSADTTTPGNKQVAPVVAFAITAEAPLTIAERIGVGVIADMFERYALILPSSASYQLPRIFDEYRRDWPDNAWGVPAKIASEEKAFQLAQVAERILGTEAEIIRESDGSFVVVVPHTDRITRDDAMVRLFYAIDLLNHFDIAEGDAGMIAVDEDGQEMYNRSLDGAEAYMAQQRIESMLKEILSRLGQNAAMGAETPSTATARTKGRGLEALIPASGKKSSSKRSA